MAENFAQAFRTVAASTAGTAYVDSVVAMLSHASQTRWSVTSSVAGKALLTCAATGAQVVLHGAASQVQVGFAPDGGVTSWDTSPTASVWTGLRNITQNTANYSGTARTVYLASYEDAIAIFITSSIGGFSVAVLVGKVLEPLDLSDVAANVGVDAMFIGAPSTSQTTNVNPGNWLRASDSANWVAHAPCLRVGDVFRPLWCLGNRVVDVTSPILAQLGTVERLLPYLAHEMSGVAAGGQAGASKYLRQWRNNLPPFTRLASDDPTSQQAWLGYSVGSASAQINQVVLWNKTETLV